VGEEEGKRSVLRVLKDVAWVKRAVCEKVGDGVERRTLSHCSLLYDE